MGLLKNEQLTILLFFLVFMLCGWYERLKILSYLFVFMICGCSNGLMLLDGKQYQGFACYGNDGYIFINASCPSGSVIAAGNVEYGVKLKNVTKCTGYVWGNEMIDYFELCCKPDASNANTDCLLETEIESPYLYCTGRVICVSSIRAEWTTISNTKCDTIRYGSVYEPLFTSYMIFNYFCIEETRILSVNAGSKTINASIVYLWNTDYPNSTIPANTKSNCSIELENCSAFISVITVHVNLPMISNGTCKQTIRFLTSNGELVHKLSCSIYRNISSIYTSSDTYLYIETENLSGNQSGHFWLGFRASEVSTFHVSCPGKNRTYCIPTKAPTSTTTMTVTPSTTTTTAKTLPSSTSTSISTSQSTSSTATPSSATTVNGTNPPPSPVQKSDNDSKTGIIIGVVVGAVALIAIIIIIALRFIWHKLKQRDKRNTEKNVMESESAPSHLKSRNGVPPINHSTVKKTIEEPTDKEYDEERKRNKDEKKERKRKKEEMRLKRMETTKNVKPDFYEPTDKEYDEERKRNKDEKKERKRKKEEMRLKRRETTKNVKPDFYGQTDGGNEERGKAKEENRKKKKKTKDKEHHVYNTTVQTADSDQPDLLMGHAEGGNAWANQPIAPLDIRDKTKTMIREDPVQDEAEKRHRKIKKRHSERLIGIEAAGQMEDEKKTESRGRRKKKRKKQTRKEDKRRLNDVEERLPSFEEHMHKFENEVYPTSDSN